MPFANELQPGLAVRLADHDANADGGLTKEAGQKRLAKLRARLDVLQEELYAAGSQSLLCIFQGMDTSGKDGVIRNVFEVANPQGMQVSSFKVPTEDELSRDFLWRVHKQVPAKGIIGIFNRSHYEDVLVVRVHNLVSADVWQQRYEQINAFERLLNDTGTIVMKFFLHISREEQEERLLEREQDVTKAWKLSAGDWKERTHWDAYMAAYEDALSRCNTPAAPWYVVPANRKWFRNIAVAEAVVERLERERAGWQRTLDAMSKQRLAELAAYRSALAVNG